jgi:hypothetical protein
MKKLTIVLGAAISVGIASLARATVMYSYVAELKGTSVDFYLQEVSTSGSFTAASDGGLYSAGVALVEEPGGTGVTFTAAGISPNGATEPNGFSGNSTKGLVTSGGVWLYDVTSPGATVGVAPASSTTSNGTTTSLYLLGSATLNTGSIFNATFLVESLHDAPTADGVTEAGSNGNTLTGNGAAPGAVGANGHPTTLTISNTPEPASVALFAIAAIGLLSRRRQAE